jgi:hypothetical protein
MTPTYLVLASKKPQGMVFLALKEFHLAVV